MSLADITNLQDQITNLQNTVQYIQQVVTNFQSSQTDNTAIIRAIQALDSEFMDLSGQRTIMVKRINDLQTYITNIINSNPTGSGSNNLQFDALNVQIASLQADIKSLQLHNPPSNIQDTLTYLQGSIASINSKLTSLPTSTVNTSDPNIQRILDRIDNVETKIGTGAADPNIQRILDRINDVETKLSTGIPSTTSGTGTGSTQPIIDSINAIGNRLSTIEQTLLTNHPAHTETLSDTSVQAIANSLNQIQSSSKAVSDSKIQSIIDTINAMKNASTPINSTSLESILATLANLETSKTVNDTHMQDILNTLNTIKTNPQSTGPAKDETTYQNGTTVKTDVITFIPNYEGGADTISLNSPHGIAVDNSNNVIYIADTNNHCIRKYDINTGIITAIAGTRRAGFSGDGGDPKKAQLNAPQDICLDRSGRIFIADTGNNRIRMIENDIIKTIAGGDSTVDSTGPIDPSLKQYYYIYPNMPIVPNEFDTYYQTRSGEYFTALTAYNTAMSQRQAAIDALSVTAAPIYALNSPCGICMYEFGGSFFLFIADTTNNRILKVTFLQTTELTAHPNIYPISLQAGTGIAGFSGDTGIDGADGKPLACQFNAPSKVTLGMSLYLYNNDVDWRGNILKSVAQNIYLYIADSGNNCIRLANFNNSDLSLISRYAGQGIIGAQTDTNAYPVGTALFNNPYYIACDINDPAHTLYIADTANNSIRYAFLNSGNIATFIAGTTPPYTPNKPKGIAVDRNGIIYISDTNNHNILTYDTNAVNTTPTLLIGSGAPGFAGDTNDYYIPPEPAPAPIPQPTPAPAPAAIVVQNTLNIYDIGTYTATGLSISQFTQDKIDTILSYIKTNFLNLYTIINSNKNDISSYINPKIVNLYGYPNSTRPFHFYILLCNAIKLYNQIAPPVANFISQFTLLDPIVIPSTSSMPNITYTCTDAVVLCTTSPSKLYHDITNNIYFVVVNSIRYNLRDTNSNASPTFAATTIISNDPPISRSSGAYTTVYGLNYDLPIIFNIAGLTSWNKSGKISPSIYLEGGSYDLNTYPLYTYIYPDVPATLTPNPAPVPAQYPGMNPMPQPAAVESISNPAPPLYNIIDTAPAPVPTPAPNPVALVLKPAPNPAPLALKPAPNPVALALKPAPSPAPIAVITQPPQVAQPPQPSTTSHHFRDRTITTTTKIESDDDTDDTDDESHHHHRHSYDENYDTLKETEKFKQLTDLITAFINKPQPPVSVVVNNNCGSSTTPTTPVTPLPPAKKTLETWEKRAVLDAFALINNTYTISPSIKILLTKYYSDCTALINEENEIKTISKLIATYGGSINLSELDSINKSLENMIISNQDGGNQIQKYKGNNNQKNITLALDKLEKNLLTLKQYGGQQVRSLDEWEKSALNAALQIPWIPPVAAAPAPAASATSEMNEEQLINIISNIEKNLTTTNSFTLAQYIIKELYPNLIVFLGTTYLNKFIESSINNNRTPGNVFYFINNDGIYYKSEAPISSTPKNPWLDFMLDTAIFLGNPYGGNYNLVILPAPAPTPAPAASLITTMEYKGLTIRIKLPNISGGIKLLISDTPWIEDKGFKSENYGVYFFPVNATGVYEINTKNSIYTIFIYSTNDIQPSVRSTYNDQVIITNIDTRDSDDKITKNAPVSYVLDSIIAPTIHEDYTIISSPLPRVTNVNIINNRITITVGCYNTNVLFDSYAIYCPNVPNSSIGVDITSNATHYITQPSFNDLYIDIALPGTYNIYICGYWGALDGPYDFSSFADDEPVRGNYGFIQVPPITINPAPAPTPAPKPVPIAQATPTNPAPAPNPMALVSTPPAPAPIPNPAPQNPAPAPGPIPNPYPNPKPAPGPIPNPYPNPKPIPSPSPKPSPVPKPLPAPAPMPVAQVRSLDNWETAALDAALRLPWIATGGNKSDNYIDMKNIKGGSTAATAHTYTPLKTNTEVVAAFNAAEKTHWDQSTYDSTQQSEIRDTNTETNIRTLRNAVGSTLVSGYVTPDVPSFDHPALPGPCTTAQGVRVACDAAHLPADVTSPRYSKGIGYGFTATGGARKRSRSPKSPKKKSPPSRMARRRSTTRKVSRKGRKATRKNRSNRSNRR